MIEASKRFLYIQQTKVTTDSVNKLNAATDQVLQTLSLLDAHRVKNSVDTAVKQNYIESVQIFSTNSLPVNKSQPTVYFRLHPDSVYKPKICEDSNGLDLPFQEDVFLAPHELKKVNLGVQFQLPKHFCALLMNKSSARLKYEITVTLGLIDKGFQDYIQVVIQNMSKKPLILPAGTAVAQLLLIKSKIPDFVPEWPEATGSRGSFGSTGQEFEKITLNTNFLLNSNLERCATFHLTEMPLQVNPLLHVQTLLNPDKIFVNNIPIKFLGDNISNSQTNHSFHSMEAEFMDSSPHDLAQNLPTLPLTLCNTDVNSLPFRKFEAADNTDIKLDASTIASLLAADLADNRKLSIESLVYFQTTDPLIAKIKDNLLGTTDLKSFVLKKNVVCKLFQGTPDIVPKFAIYIPTVLLLPTIIYVHTHFLHASKTQTFREFAQLYYHPNAKRMIAKVCNACLTCSMARNPENRSVPVGQIRSLQPTAPRQMVSIDILYFPTSSKGHTHGLMIADLFSLYVSFFPLKGKLAAQIATSLRTFFSLQGVPKVVYSDNDQSFLGEVQTLLSSYNIQHATSFPYSQKQNAVESQVRKFKNAYRSALLNNPIFSHREWHVIYPLVVIRLNTLISKYGLSREYVHFKDVLDTHLPLITEIPLTGELESDLDQLSHTFRAKVAKFLRNKEKSKQTYKPGKKYNFYLHELVMQKVYTPSSLLHPTFNSPFSELLKFQNSVQ